MPDERLAPPPELVDVDPAALARRSTAQSRTPMPVWLSLVVLLACVLAANLGATLLRGSAAVFEWAPGAEPPPVVRAEPAAPPPPAHRAPLEASGRASLSWAAACGLDAVPPLEPGEPAPDPRPCLA